MEKNIWKWFIYRFLWLVFPGNCSHREDCTLKEWGAWSGDVPSVGCAVQIRNREYNKSIIYIEQESCEGLDVCPAIRDETRTKCKYSYVFCTDFMITLNASKAIHLYHQHFHHRHHQHLGH